VPTCAIALLFSFEIFLILLLAITAYQYRVLNPLFMPAATDEYLLVKSLLLKQWLLCRHPNPMFVTLLLHHLRAHVFKFIDIQFLLRLTPSL
jgi:hypothetical protein